MEGSVEVAYYPQPTTLFGEQSAPSTSSTGATAAVVTSPILEFLFFHKAIRVELGRLHRYALAVEKGGEKEFQALSDRYEFLRVVYTQHSNAEDEVIFPALDSRVKNIAQTYSLEHQEESDLFDEMLDLLNSALKEKSNASAKLRRELICCTEAIQTSLCKHLSKEEEQVFPLLIQHFSFEEQAALVWQFMCSIPVNLMEEFLPWISSCLSKDERREMIACMHKVVPKEKLLWQVVFSWLKGRSMQGKGKAEKVAAGETDACNMSFLVEPTKDYLMEELSTSQEVRPAQHLKGACTMMLCEGKDSCLTVRHHAGDMETGGHSPFDILLFWHKAIRKELQEFAKEVRVIQSLSPANIPSFSERLQFLAEVCRFHSAAEDKVLFPAIGEKSKQSVTFKLEHSHEQRQFDEMRCLVEGVQGGVGVGLPSDIRDKLCEHVDMIVHTIQQHLLTEETEVLPLGRAHCSTEEQRALVYQSLRVMPLKLLERVLPWLVAMLNEEEAKSMLENVCLAAPPSDTALVTLFLGWACKGRARKAPTSGSYGCFSSNNGDDCLVKKLSWAKVGGTSCKCAVTALNSSEGQEEYDIENAQGRSLKRIRYDNSVYEEKCTHVEAVESEYLWKAKACCVPGLGVGGSSLGFGGASGRRSFPCSPLQSDYLGSGLFGLGSDLGSPGAGAIPKPIDTIFQFHKAIRKDLEYLDDESAGLSGCDDEFLRQFTGRFRLLWGLYRAHSNAEDDIVFPALEAKEALHNVSHSYTIDHKHEEQLFQEISNVLTELSLLQGRLHAQDHSGLFALPMALKGCISEHQSLILYKQDLAAKLQGMCKSVHVTLDQHVSREELELWPLFALHFKVEEQEKLVGQIIGTTGAEVLQAMLPWVTTALSQEEQTTMMSTWRQATRNTMFDKWLRAWWKESPTGSPQSSVSSEDEIPKSGTPESLQMVADYLSKGRPEDSHEKDKVVESLDADLDWNRKSTTSHVSRELDSSSSKNVEINGKPPKVVSNETYTPARTNDDDSSSEKAFKNKIEAGSAKFKPGWQDIFRMNEKELEAAIRKVSGDTSLDPRRKAYLMQNLMTSRWIVAQQHSHKSLLEAWSGDSTDIPGRSASYTDANEGVFGCEHYKRNCKIRAACCGVLFPCRFCHDKVSDHTMDRQATKEMMCMKCLCVQPVAQFCTTPSCEGFCMAKYYCSICKLFDDKRDIYHCPSCNLCRVGKGLGVDFFHCMTCNACMSTSLTSHKCRERGLESNCPICHDYLFTSHTPVKALSCGHFMHSSCYRAYTYSHYTCPICSKSLGDMDVYFGMLDALLASEQLPEEYRDRRQDILCNDCQQKGTAPFHWLYHKCSKCGSYNTRAI